MSQVHQLHEHSPVVLEHQKQRAQEFSLRIADKVTAFAGSMTFVYIHTVVFAVWMLILESDPWPRLTLCVSLEAIYLSTFILISQNRQSAFQQQKADHDFHTAEQEIKTNTELTRTIHDLTAEIRDRIVSPPERRS
jgi:uncharacterized membrane protein